MATPPVTPLAAFIMAISSTLFRPINGPINAALVVVFAAVWLFADFLDPVLLRVALQAIIAASVLALLLQSIRITRRKVETAHWNGPGKVLLFPCQTSHSRIFPKKHSFSHSYLLVGIPVGFEGDAGGVVSVGATGKPGRSSWLSNTLWGSWFTVDAGDYLERGKSELGLRGKLDEYLQTQVSAVPGPTGQHT
jgi:hypothetical protein